MVGEAGRGWGLTATDMMLLGCGTSADAVLRRHHLTAASPASDVSGTWRLVFSTSTGNRAFQYIPVSLARQPATQPTNHAAAATDGPADAVLPRCCPRAPLRA
jgi:hypothetical protein